MTEIFSKIKRWLDAYTKRLLDEMDAYQNRGRELPSYILDRLVKPSEEDQHPLAEDVLQEWNQRR